MTPVIFRVWKGKEGGVLALFPADPADYAGYQVDSYEHVGQHGAADYQGCIARTRPAQPHEYAPLLAELKAYGDGSSYPDLAIYQRQTRGHRAALKAAVAAMKRARSK